MLLTETNNAIFSETKNAMFLEAIVQHFQKQWYNDFGSNVTTFAKVIYLFLFFIRVIHEPPLLVG
jgi:hypothetical protein